MVKIIDCITFYDENLLTNSRFEILKDVVHKFIVCESNYDHSGNEKKINFKLLNKDFSEKVHHLVIKDNFPKPIKPWENEKIQREYILKALSFCDEEDYIMYSDADEIPNESLMINIHAILEENEVDVVLVPRVNTVEGLTQEHINKWRWNVNEKGWVNWPDYQTRIIQNSPKIKWQNKVHEQIIGVSTQGALPMEEEWCLYHPKHILRQEAQNNFYDTL